MTHGYIAEQSVHRTAPSGPCAPVPRCIIHYKTTIPFTCESYEWNVVKETHSYANTGDQCTGYDKFFKYGKAPGWVSVREAHDLYPGTDGGPLYVDEIDYMGAPGRLTTGAAVLCVIGRSATTAVRDPVDLREAHLDAFFRLVPYVPDWGFAKLNYLIRAEVKCEKAILSMQGGDRVKFSDDPAVAEHGFDPQTGFTGYWKGRLLVWGVHNVTGEVVQMRQL